MISLHDKEDDDYCSFLGPPIYDSLIVRTIIIDHLGHIGSKIDMNYFLLPCKNKKGMNLGKTKSFFYADLGHNEKTHENPSSIKKNHKCMVDVSLCSLEDDRYGDLFAKEKDRHRCDNVHCPYEHDMGMDSWKFMGELTHDPFNEESKNIEYL